MQEGIAPRLIRSIKSIKYKILIMYYPYSVTVQPLVARHTNGRYQNSNYFYNTGVGGAAQTHTHPAAPTHTHTLI